MDLHSFPVILPHFLAFSTTIKGAVARAHDYHLQGSFFAIPERMSVRKRAISTPFFPNARDTKKRIAITLMQLLTRLIDETGAYGTQASANALQRFDSHSMHEDISITWHED